VSCHLTDGAMTAGTLMDTEIATSAPHARQQQHARLLLRPYKQTTKTTQRYEFHDVSHSVDVSASEQFLITPSDPTDIWTQPAPYKLPADDEDAISGTGFYRLLYDRNHHQTEQWTVEWPEQNVTIRHEKSLTSWHIGCWEAATQTTTMTDNISPSSSSSSSSSQ